MSTVPMFAPDGTLGDIPFAQMKSALAAGAKPGVTIKSPDGKLGVVPADRYQDAAKAGATIVPIQDQETKHPGFWANAADDLKGLLHPSGFSPYPGMDMEAKQAAAQQSADQDRSRKAAGYSLPYRALAPVAQAVGTNVPGMEKSAAEGDVAGVAGHAAAAAAPIVAAEAIHQGAPAVTDALKAKVSPATQAAMAAAPDAVGAALKKLPGATLRHVPWIGDVLHDMYKAGAEAYSKAQPSPTAPVPAVDPLTSPARTLPGMNPPEVIRPPVAAAPATAQPIPARPGLQLSGEVAAPAQATSQASALAAAEPTKTLSDLSGTPSGEGLPRTLSGESALRQVLPGNKADLMKIAKSRGISTTQEAQLVPNAASKSLMDKIVNDFSPDELDEVRSRYIENTRMEHTGIGNIAQALQDQGMEKKAAVERAEEAWNVVKKQTYFPDLNIPAAELNRAKAAIAATKAKPTTISAAKAAIDSASDDLTPVWGEQLRRTLAQQKATQQ